MASRTSDFERFLYANYPDDYRRATAPDVSDDVIEAILSRHRSHYDIWKDIPEWIKSEYGDKLPSEVLNGNVTPRQFVNEEIEKDSVKDVELDTSMDFLLMGVSASVLSNMCSKLAEAQSKGYSQESAITFAKNMGKRAQIMSASRGGELTAEQEYAWRETRESDKSTIANDWMHNQSEKYLLHVVKEISREYKRAQREGREPSAEKMETLNNELKHHMTGLETTEDKRKLAVYLSQEPQQAALKHLDPSVLEMLTGMLKEQGIVITPINKDKSKSNDMEVEEESLSESLEKDFNKMQKMKSILINKYNYQNDKSSVRDVLHSNDGVGHLMALKRSGASKQM
jgi:gas vesicle protein